MTRETIATRSGAPTLRVNGTLLHSRYDPPREAERFAAGLQPRATPLEVVILAGDGVPHLAEAILRRFAGVQILRLTFQPDISADATPPSQTLDITGRSEEEIRSWIRQRLHPLKTAGTELVVWEPARRAVPEAITAAERAVARALQDLSAQIATVGSFGVRWLTNAVRAGILPDTRWFVRGEAGHALLATSGPSLELLFQRDPPDLPVLATSSAATTILAAGITPALVVHTDGGFWAAQYLRHRAVQNGLVVATLPRAGVPLAILARDPGRLMFLRTGWIGDALAVDSDAWPALPEQPTVAATLVGLADHLLPNATLTTVGFDLASRDLLDHSRPHPHDGPVFQAVGRLDPLETVRARRCRLGDARRGEWSDGLPAYQSPALAAFRSAFSTMMRREAAATVSVPGIPRSPFCPFPPATVQPTRGPAHRSPAALHGRSVRRPPPPDRLAHLRRTLEQWWDRSSAAGDAAATADPIDRELILHLAPVEYLRARRGAADPESVVAALRRGIGRLQALAERLDG